MYHLPPPDVVEVDAGEGHVDLEVPPGEDKQLKGGEDNQIIGNRLKGSQNKTTMDSDVSDLLKTLSQAKKTTNINKNI